MTDEACDYCDARLAQTFHLRAVGYINVGGVEHPQVKAWCGECDPSDDIDPIADAAVQRAFAAQRDAS